MRINISELHKPHRLSKLRRSKGQGLLEFALISPILLVLLFGIVDMGWIAFNFAQLFNGVREGVRYGSVPGFDATKQYVNCSGIRARIVDMAGFSGIKNSTSDISIWYDDGRPFDTTTSPNSKVGTCDSAYVGTPTSSANPYKAQGSSTATLRNVQNGDRIVVSVSVKLHFLTPFINALAPDGISVSFTTARSIFPDGLLA
jgi:hypothetical protein